MRYSIFLIACLAVSFGVAEDATVTLPPSTDVEAGNDQDPLGSFLGEEPESESPQDLDSLIESEEELEAEEELIEEEITEEELAEGGGLDEAGEDELPETIPSPEGDEQELPAGEDLDVAIEEELPETVPSAEEGEDELPETVDEDELPETEPIPEEDEDELPETVPSPEGDEGEATEEPVVGGADEDAVGEDLNDVDPDEIPTDEDLFGEIVEEEEEEETPVDEDKDFSFGSFTDFPTPVPQPRFTPYPTALRKPSLRPATPYHTTDDDPLKDDEDEAFDNWGFNEDTLEEVEKDVEEMAQDPKVVIALSTVFGVMFLFSIFIAFQLIENPNGCCASICRISVACICGITRCICYPCRAMCGCTGQSNNRQDHMMLPNDGHFTHDLELS